MTTLSALPGVSPGVQGTLTDNLSAAHQRKAP